MRFTAFIFPLLACGAAGYFAYHLETGDHGLEARAERGLVGMLIVDGEPNPEIYDGVVTPGMGH